MVLAAAGEHIALAVNAIAGIDLRSEEAQHQDLMNPHVVADENAKSANAMDDDCDVAYAKTRWTEQVKLDRHRILQFRQQAQVKLTE